MLQWELECGLGRLFQPSGSAVAFLRRLVLHNVEPRVQQGKNSCMRRQNMKTHTRKKAFYYTRGSLNFPGKTLWISAAQGAHAKPAILPETDLKPMPHSRVY